MTITSDVDERQRQRHEPDHGRSRSSPTPTAAHGGILLRTPRVRSVRRFFT